MKKYRHVVLFKIHDAVTESDMDRAVTLLSGLGKGHEGLEEWKVNASIDTRKGRIIVEEAIFTAEADYQRFKISDSHMAAGDSMKGIADWWVGDYED